jgi:hypothetical protein
VSTTFYIRKVVGNRLGEIVNAVECQTIAQAREVVACMTGGPYEVDSNPPLTVLARYQYWNERP